MGYKDPDIRVIGLYIEDKEHEWTDHPDKDEYWLGALQGDADTDRPAS